MIRFFQNLLQQTWLFGYRWSRSPIIGWFWRKSESIINLTRYSSSSWTYYCYDLCHNVMRRNALKIHIVYLDETIYRLRPLFKLYFLKKRCFKYVTFKDFIFCNKTKKSTGEFIFNLAVSWLLDGLFLVPVIICDHEKKFFSGI